eukprot:CAMPEP_0116144758 /NCGR_PEP_ID=MMETSP0329-20121206/16191_1 /TAXON_ID=697910 /ORGANISM="Pseudo-nitzschia arenysensis, Strain B593" /LENGTH=287 /DNA_ID=CAMNT_0003640239 /DNA_START=59 /DNA_END=922 /DNA_ORIENTATION=+
MIELEAQASPVTTATNSSKVYVRYFSYTAYYEIDRTLPPVLDNTRSGGTRAAITNEEWLSFCDRIDKGFQRLNTMQCINFYCDLFIMIAVVFYLALVYVIYIFPFRSRFVFFLIALAIANAIFNLFIRGPATTTAVNNAKRICEEETSRINLRSGHGNAISILFHYTKRKCCNCEGYEFDRNEEQRYHDIYVGITLQSERYAGEATATLVDDLYGGTPIATATEVTTATEIPVRRGQRPYRPSAPFTNERADARNTPYVTIPPPPMATAEIVGTTEDDDEEAQTQAQ